MRLFDRLVQLDNAVLPKPKRYDQRVPAWLALAGVFGSVWGTVIVQVVVRTSGALRVAVIAAAASLFGAYCVAASRWTRRHRVAHVRRPFR